MAITSADIQNQSFKIERRGYDVDEVDVFLEHVSSEIDQLNNEISRLNAQLSEVSQTAPAPAPEPEAALAAQMSAADAAELVAAKAKVADLEAKLRERKSDDSAIAQALIVAQRTADEIVSKAKAEAEQTRRNAEEEGKRILDKANAEKQTVITHINELSASREQVREQYQDMLKEFIGQATQRLSEIGGEATAGIDIPSELLHDVKFEAGTVEAPKTASVTPVSKWENPSVAAYTTPTVTPVVAAPATPKPSAPSKDFSGYGDADDSFSFDEID